jgi:UDP-N-acetylglucosamine diphosphorylase / glucose-1-phosphate thymidylyltransferase / UDP-N-acetylgalactosamine diphosphorylase / glucosamine-1-phosphate N-acetyltransferase / galactosamine-1-phosphate N-acetyltransferase
VAGKPIVARVFDLFLQNGIEDVILLVSPDDDAIIPYFEQYAPRNVQVTFVVQQQRLGMAHALGLVAPHLQGDFMMSACDNLAPAAHLAALLATHRACQASATLSLMEIDIAHSASTGIVEWEAGTQGDNDRRFIRRIVEKPQPADAPSNIASLPLYVFSPTILDYLPEVKPSPRGEYELQDAIQLLIDRCGRVTGVLTDVRWQLTNVADLLALSRHYLALEEAQHPYQLQARYREVQFIPPVRIDGDCIIEPSCVIGPHVYLEPGCQIGAGARIENAILLGNARVEAGTVVTGAVIM